MAMKAIVSITVLISIVDCNELAESMRVQAQEQEITKSAQMNFDNFKLYPFAISVEHEFSLSFTQNNQVKGEMRVSWVDSAKKDLTFPTYDILEYIKVSIIDMTTGEIVQQRQFHFETGISFLALAKHKYRLIFKDFGQRNKMVQLTLSHIEPFRMSELSQTNLTNSTQKAIEIGKTLELEILNLAVQSERSEMTADSINNWIQNNISSYCLFSIWEIILVSAMMIAQIFIFSRLIDKNNQISV